MITRQELNAIQSLYDLYEDESISKVEVIQNDQGHHTIEYLHDGVTNTITFSLKDDYGVCYSVKGKSFCYLRDIPALQAMSIITEMNNDNLLDFVDCDEQALQDLYSKLKASVMVVGKEVPNNLDMEFDIVFPEVQGISDFFQREVAKWEHRSNMPLEQGLRDFNIDQDGNASITIEKGHDLHRQYSELKNSFQIGIRSFTLLPDPVPVGKWLFRVGQSVMVWIHGKWVFAECIRDEFGENLYIDRDSGVVLAKHTHVMLVPAAPDESE